MYNTHNFLSAGHLEAARLATKQFKVYDRVYEQARSWESNAARQFVERARLWEAGPAKEIMEQMRHEEALRRAILPHLGRVARVHDFSLTMRVQEELACQQRGAFSPGVLAQAYEIARFAQGLRLPTTIDRFRASAELFADKLLLLPNFDWKPAYLAAFNEASAFSDLIAHSDRVDRELREATQAFTATAIPGFETLAAYRRFLDAAGLVLPRWPRFRLRSAAEKRRHVEAALKRNVEPSHVKRAKSMVHRYELTLREFLDLLMADTYGEDWALQRLPLCDCNDLLGKWKKRGGNVFDHADYAHYERIMSHPHHFEAIFSAGFDDRVALASLMNKAGRLRAASHHAGPFTPEDLRELRSTWLTIKAGLVALTNNYEVEWGA